MSAATTIMPRICAAPPACSCTGVKLCRSVLPSPVIVALCMTSVKIRLCHRRSHKHSQAQEET